MRSLSLENADSFFVFEFLAYAYTRAFLVNQCFKDAKKTRMSKKKRTRS